MKGGDAGIIAGQYKNGQNTRPHSIPYQLRKLTQVLDAYLLSEATYFYT